MTIVASNSLTVSKVSDGTITHTAWSYSADGTDRFTTVYPNLNLLVNSSAKTKDGFFKSFDKVENGYGELTRKGNNSYAGISMWDGFSIQPGDYKPGDTYTMSMDVMFTSWNFPAGVYLEEFWIGQRYTHNSDWSINSWKRICFIDLPKDPNKMMNQWIRITNTSTIPPHEDPSVYTESIFLTKFSGSGEASFTLRIRNPKQEPGSVATPHMLSASEVTTADWPKYIGHYTDFTQADSTNPSDYTWGPMRGDDGVGIKTTDISYANSTSGTTAPSTGWTSSVPSLVKGQYLWIKTVWISTDTSSKTAYSVSYNSKDGTNGTNGASGIIVSSVAPSNPQTGQLWQDTSTTPQLVKKWTGASWVIWELYVENMNVNNLSALSPNLGTITGGSYESWSSDINQESSNVNFNGIYIKNGKNRSLTIIYPENTTPDKNTFQGGLYTGTQTGNDGISYFAINSNQMDNITPHELLTELDNPYGFWERMALNNISSYAGKLFTSYKDGISHGLAFDSPNGLSVIGDLSVTGSVTTNTTSSVTVALFYGMTVDFRRQGNLVIASIGRQVRTTREQLEDVVILEKVPSGYRPSYLHYFEINRNSSINVLTGLIMGFEPNGDVRVTIGAIEPAVFSGSTSYFTTDPLP